MNIPKGYHQIGAKSEIRNGVQTNTVELVKDKPVASWLELGLDTVNLVLSCVVGVAVVAGIVYLLSR